MSSARICCRDSSSMPLGAGTSSSSCSFIRLNRARTLSDGASLTRSGSGTNRSCSSPSEDARESGRHPGQYSVSSSLAIKGVTRSALERGARLWRRRRRRNQSARASTVAAAPKSPPMSRPSKVIGSVWTRA
ncbi:hypothetical protein FA95DRAFT_825683 [Auriscalpium vulgare]|uniref:Uncharacterized protein n=1 Tax=Auriscalpium vulgare TaxID=40419 RepID=A0ACB8RAU1_9AGAM|nr:hypothetical protein FA95DRAFT_825683 [Auriscalpium vulgare]